MSFGRMALLLPRSSGASKLTCSTHRSVPACSGCQISSQLLSRLEERLSLRAHLFSLSHQSLATQFLSLFHESAQLYKLYHDKMCLEVCICRASIQQCGLRCHVEAECRMFQYFPDSHLIVAGFDLSQRHLIAHCIAAHVHLYMIISVKSMAGRLFKVMRLPHHICSAELHCAPAAQDLLPSGDNCQAQKQQELQRR